MICTLKFLVHPRNKMKIVHFIAFWIIEQIHNFMHLVWERENCKCQKTHSQLPQL